MALLRRKWNKLNRNKRSEKTIEAYLSYQREVFYNPSTIVEDDITMSSASSPEQNVEGGSTVEENEEVHMRTVPLSPLDELSQRHARRRTDAILTQLNEVAEKQMITVTQLLGYLLYRVNYTHDKAVAEVGKKLFDQESVDREVTLDEALYMLSTYRLGRSAYTSLRHDLMQKVDLPAHYKLMQHKNMIMPSVSSPIGVSGVSVNLCESVQIHFQRLIEILGLQPGTYRMSAKEGLDGSGRHAIYDQKGNVETHNMILWMWVPLEVSKDLDQDQPSTSQSNVIWTEGTPHSPDAARPILITLGKEDSDLLNKIVPPVDGEIELLHRSGVTVDDYGKVYELKIQFLRSMNDGKMQKLLVGRGGAFCILCSFTKEDAVSVDQIQDGFEMDNVDIDTLKALYKSLEVDGEVSKSRGDYEERMGLTQIPITSFNVHTFPIFHALLRGLDYCLK